MPFEPMPADDRKAPDYADAVLCAALLAVDPGLGGMVIRARYGAARDQFLAAFKSLTSGCVRKVPLNIADDRLLGGLDLAATLAAGRPVMMQGLLAEAAEGVLVLAMAERLSTTTAARIATALDATPGMTVLALDEGVTEEEAPPAALLDRLGFTVPEDALPMTDAAWPDVYQVAHARMLLAGVQAGADAPDQICRLSAMFGILSPRAALFALRAARAAAALAGRLEVTPEDIALAARLVLLPRALVMPAPEEQTSEAEAQQEDAPPEAASEDGEQQAPSEDDTITPETAQAILPPALLDALLNGQVPRRMARGGGQSGGGASLTRGRPAGVRPGRIGNGARLSVIDTLRAAVPWQGLRPRTTRIAVRADDFRILRFKERARTIAIFAVDASGSAALNRLAEAKGAVQLLLADCYVRRDQVAVLAFRGRAAEILLPPTHALARARRSLASLPGGGPTPLAIGIDAARLLAEGERRKGLQPLLVLLTDGGANIGRDGNPGRATAAADALAAAKLCRAAGFAALVVDTAPRPQAFVAQLALAMGARYLPLPYADSAALSRAVQQTEAANVRLAA
jgi:magnesium chelatase subunit D